MYEYDTAIKELNGKKEEFHVNVIFSLSPY